jgi:predicted O-methyltransferase YrrM
VGILKKTWRNLRKKDPPQKPPARFGLSSAEIAKPSLVSQFENLYDPESHGYYYPERWWIPRQLENLTKEQGIELREAIKRDKPENLIYSPVELEVAQSFYWILRMIGAKYVLETGTNMGYSTSLIACAIRDNGGGCVDTIDVNKNDVIWERTELEPYITFHHGSSLEVALPDRQYDVLLLDSDHSYDTIMGEVIRFESKLKIGGLCIFHDTFYFDGIGICVSQLMQTRRYEVVNLPTPRHGGRASRTPGITLARKIIETPTEPDLRLLPDALGIEIDVRPERRGDPLPWIDCNHPLKDFGRG